MVVEWLKKTFGRKEGSFRDRNKYIISQGVIEFTIMVLQQYGNKDAEGIVYWAGYVENNVHTVTAAVAPAAVAYRRDIFTTHDSNARFIDFISEHDLVYIAQVHSHPSNWVDHSDVDDKETAFRSEGLISIVVPNFGEKGMRPLYICGIHRFNDSAFHRLSNKYIRRRFFIKPLDNYILKDLRHE